MILPPLTAQEASLVNDLYNKFLTVHLHPLHTAWGERIRKQMWKHELRAGLRDARNHDDRDSEILAHLFDRIIKKELN